MCVFVLQYSQYFSFDLSGGGPALSLPLCFVLFPSYFLSRLAWCCLSSGLNRLFSDCIAAVLFEQSRFLLVSSCWMALTISSLVFGLFVPMSRSRKSSGTCLHNCKGHKLPYLMRPRI